ncbi:MAG: hypothetical protein RPS47_04940 [Colwellia sp.]|jgi:hypothetical protein
MTNQNFCEHCIDKPATNETEELSLCDDCFEHYVDGYREKD